ncbi:transposable element tc3 transposase [Lasius niger]|uniref:Transposable element tc3 transposase n=1 Tax=Lasius niger TaxID=67767 RepID=A0A0J7KRY7_LASNI|nr:transposable element tc3 transposase [Lasius niger]
MLQSELPEMLEVVNPNMVQRMWIQQDGTPPHFARIVTNILYLTYGQRWIGRDGYVAWPPRSPDLTTPDFFWGVSKGCCVSEDTYYAGKYQGAHKTSVQKYTGNHAKENH